MTEHQISAIKSQISEAESLINSAFWSISDIDDEKVKTTLLEWISSIRYKFKEYQYNYSDFLDNLIENFKKDE